MTDDAKPTGRPKGSATGQTPMRTLRMGPLWEQGQAAAKVLGMTMTALVEEALREKLLRLHRKDRREATEPVIHLNVEGGPPCGEKHPERLTNRSTELTCVACRKWTWAKLGGQGAGEA